MVCPPSVISKSHDRSLPLLPQRTSIHPKPVQRIHSTHSCRRIPPTTTTCACFRCAGDRHSPTCPLQISNILLRQSITQHIARSAAEWRFCALNGDTHGNRRTGPPMARLATNNYDEIGPGPRAGHASGYINNLLSYYRTSSYHIPVPNTP